MTGVMKISDLVRELNTLLDIAGDLPVYRDGEEKKDWPYFAMPMHIDFENKRLVLGRCINEEES